MTEARLLEQTADTIRVLAAEAVEQANSGHPGMPMGCADIGATLWYKHLRHDPSDPNWMGRDRFILSAGHGSTLLYSLLHLFGYDLSLEEIKQFRQWGTRTPGHPEYGVTPGVEVTTGPLATGFATGVGMAIAAKQLAQQMENRELFDQRIYVLSSDGCMMEGLSHESASLAGHLELDNLICFYDANGISIEGSTDLAYSEDPATRFRAYGWNVLEINGHDHDEIDEALTKAKSYTKGPTLIIARTTIGCRAPNSAGSPETHGAPLGSEEVNALKSALGFSENEDFQVPDEVRTMLERRREELRAAAEKWKSSFRSFLDNNPDKAELYKQLAQQRVPENILDELRAVAPAKKMATRHAGGEVMQRAANLVPALTGGAADLAPSTKTQLKDLSDFTAQNRLGRNIHFGVRELGMGVIGNGLALFGTDIPFSSTFMVFSDFMKPAIRLAAIQNIHHIFVFTHDSVFVGEDGPTHQPVEQLMMLRNIPNLTVIRPAEGHEVAEAWAAALQAEGPVALALTRQKVEPFSEKHASATNVARGAYVLDEDSDFELILIATGSEVNTALGAAEQLRKEGKKVRVVSMPSWEMFEQQDEEYKERVLPRSCETRVSIEAGITQGWEKYTLNEGLRIGLDHFGHAGPSHTLGEKYGLDVDGVVARVKDYLECSAGC